MNQLKFLVAFFLVVILVFLSVISQPRVTVLGYENIPLIAVVLISAFIGSIISFIIGFPEVASLRRKISKKEKEIKEKDERIKELELEIKHLEDKIKGSKEEERGE